MGHKTIRSKWASFLDCYKTGRTLVTLGNGVLRKPEKMRSWDKKTLDKYLMLEPGGDELSSVARYVFSEDTKPIIRSKQTIETILLLKRFNKYRLPQRMCIAEFEGDRVGARYFVVCYEKTERNMLVQEDSKFPFFTAVFGYYDFDEPGMQSRIKSSSGRPVGGQYAILFPIICEIDNVGREHIMDDDATDEERDCGGVRYRSSPTPWIQIHMDESNPAAPIDEPSLIREFISHAGFAVRGLTAMMQTKGIAQDAITLDDVKKLNKKRAANKNAGLIPAHVYVSLGHTYSKTGQRSANPTGRKQRFHLKSAHTKMQHYGPKNSLVKEIFVEAYLVNESEGGQLVVPTRIVKP